MDPHSSITKSNMKIKHAKSKRNECRHVLQTYLKTNIRRATKVERRMTYPTKQNKRSVAAAQRRCLRL